MSHALIVDDDPRIRTVLRRVCEELHLTVHEGGDGQAVMEVFSRQPCDVVLLDLAMPRLDGFGALRWLKSQALLPAPAVLVVTALTDVEGRVQATELGALDFVDKPFRVPDVRRRIARALALVNLERRVHEAEQALATLRGRDPVTGVEATGQLFEALEAEFIGAKVGRRPLACVVVSDELYDGTLDAAGRPAGEARLQRLAEQIEKRLRGADRIFRIDASEFVLLLPGTNREGVEHVIEKIFDALAAEAEFERNSVAVAAATYPHEEITHAAQLFRAVNMALAQVRNIPGRHVEFFQRF